MLNIHDKSQFFYCDSCKKIFFATQSVLHANHEVLQYTNSEVVYTMQKQRDIRDTFFKLRQLMSI